MPEENSERGLILQGIKCQSAPSSHVQKVESRFGILVNLPSQRYNRRSMSSNWLVLLTSWGISYIPAVFLFLFIFTNVTCSLYVNCRSFMYILLLVISLIILSVVSWQFPLLKSLFATCSFWVWFRSTFLIPQSAMQTEIAYLLFWLNRLWVYFTFFF